MCMYHFFIMTWLLPLSMSMIQTGVTFTPVWILATHGCWAKDQILVIAINLSWCKTKYWQVTPTHFFYIFCYFAFDAKEQVGRPYFWSKETKEGQLNETFWIERLEYFLDLENKNSDRRSLTFDFFDSDGIHLSLITKVSTQKPRWPFS